MEFKILSKSLADGKTATFYYNNMTNELYNEKRVPIKHETAIPSPEGQFKFNFDDPEPWTKTKKVSTLKIQLGLSCNYACVYCSQRFVARPEEMTKAQVAGFMKKLDNLEFNEQNGLKIELWGGEPFVYFKTIVPLVAALKERFRDWQRQPRFSIITNGSLLSDEVCKWILQNDISIAISHDGPGQHVRGPDPFEDEDIKNNVLFLYSVLRPKGMMSFNSMLNKSNVSRKEIYDWFVDFTGDPNVPLGEGGLIDPYDEGGYSSSLEALEEHFNFRKTAFNDIYSTQGRVGFMSIVGKVDGQIDRILNAKSSEDMGQKCGMDLPDVLAIDLKGNVITCQNTSIVQKAPNGEKHLSGNIEDMSSVKIKTSTHWKDRPDCSKCPVLSLCGGSCMYLQGDYWTRACDNSFTDNISLFALALERITGMIPVYIDADHLPPERKDIWGDILYKRFLEEKKANGDN